MKVLAGIIAVCTMVGASLCHAQVYDFDIAVGSDDGRAWKSGSTVYPPNTTTFADTTTIFAGAQRNNQGGGTPYETHVGLLRWNTGPTLSGASPAISASYIFYVTNVDNADGLNLNGEWVTDGAVVTADYTNSTATTAFSVPISGFAIGGTSTYCSNSLCTVPLNNLSSISTSAYTKLRLTVSCVASNCNTVPTGYNRILGESFEHSNLHQLPRLEVVTGSTPTPSGTATPTRTSTPTITPTANTTPTRRPTNTPGLSGTASPVPNCGYIPPP